MSIIVALSIQLTTVPMNDFWFNVNYGLDHVLDINGYDHVLFLMVLAVPYAFKDWKRVLLLVSLFTLGHSVSLSLAAYKLVSVNSSLVEFLIPVTILITALYNIFTAGKIFKSKKVGLLMVSALFFGLVHGLGFGREFRMFVGESDNTLRTLLEFALGIECAQIIIVFVVLLVGFFAETLFRFSKRDWILVLSSIVVGMIIPMLLERNIFI